MPHTSHRTVSIPYHQEREVKIGLLAQHHGIYRVDFIEKGVVIGNWPIDANGLSELLNDWLEYGKRPQ